MYIFFLFLCCLFVFVLTHLLCMSIFVVVQVSIEENVTCYDNKTMERITEKILNIFPNDIGEKFVDAILEALKDKSKYSENTKVTMIHDDKKIHIKAGKCTDHWILYTVDGEVDVVNSVRKEYLDETINVPVINKRVLGKAIIKYIGNEGSEVDERKQELRRSLQAAIDYIQTHEVEGIWENATMTVYDSACNKFEFISGKGKNTFLVNYVRNEPKITYTVGHKIKTLETTNGIVVPKRGFFSRLFWAMADKKD